MSPPNGKVGDDMQTFRDPRKCCNSNAFMVYTQKPTYQIHVLKLDDSWTAFAPGEMPHQALDTHSLEAPAPFYSEISRQFYIWCSHTSGWAPNAAVFMTSAQGMVSPFKNHGNPTNATTFNTQGSHILPLRVVGKVERFLYMGDRFVPYHGTSEGSRYIFLPMEVHSDGTVKVSYEEKWTVDKWPSFIGEHVVELSTSDAERTTVFQV